MELIRIVAMLMILTLHCNLFSMKTVWSLETKNLFFTLTEFISIIAVNLYVFISGFFLTSFRFDIRKLIKLELTVIFYSVLIYIALALCGLIVFEKKVFLSLFFPLINSNYWFYTCYAVLFFLMPILKKVYLYLARVGKIKVSLLILIIISSLIPTINPGNNQLLIGEGYSFFWFITLVLVGAYLKDHPVHLGNGSLIFIFLGTLTLQLSLYYILSGIGDVPWVSRWHKFLYSYNNILVFSNSVVAFSLFTRWKITSKNIAHIIRFFSVSTFSVYLIHTHPFMMDSVLRELLDLSVYSGSIRLYLLYFLWIFGVFLACILIDKIRLFIFKLISQIGFIKKMDKRLETLNTKIAVED
ncbi:MAG: acyltransferase family protein [Clostridia bacterium]|nr:acyltransferase family protein [Clostridia bacterium]